MTAISKFYELNNKDYVSVSVVGDVMIDEYYNVQADRVSPEFPIPILLSRGQNPTLSLPGGAANVCYQFKNFKTHGYLFGICDRKAERVFRSHNINVRTTLPVNGEWLDPGRSETPIKRRFYSGDFPLCRWDVEVPCYGVKKKRLALLQEGLLETFKRIDTHVTILSDYDKGMFSGIGKRPWIENSKISIVDPKRGPASEWFGCTIFKPNAKEAAELSGRTGWGDQADYFMEQVGCEAVLITQGGTGVAGKIKDKYFEYKPKKEVYASSVIGAGDCFVATLAMALARGFTIEEATEIAFEAGAVYVQNKHNTPISPYELLSHEDPIAAKFVRPQDLANRNFKLAFTNGCFDGGLTKAHVELFNFCKKQGDKLLVALNSDCSITRLKGQGRPILSLNERMSIVSALECVDYVTFFEQDTPIEIIRQSKPDFIVKGGDYTINEVVGREHAEVIIFPLVDCVSTTEKIMRLNACNLSDTQC